MQFAIGYETEAEKDYAYRLSERLQYPINNQAAIRLQVTVKQLLLITPYFSPIGIDFNTPIRHKRGLIRACKPCKGMRIIDATAGWGIDAALLAKFGAEVLMLERHPLMGVLLEDALQRCNQVLPLQLLQENALSYLAKLLPAQYPDVIYLDPMHPIRKKSALVKKELQLLQQLIGPDEDASELLTLALTRTRQKVIVKWPKSQPSLLTPHASIEGKTVKFDIFKAEQ